MSDRPSEPDLLDGDGPPSDPRDEALSLDDVDVKDLLRAAFAEPEPEKKREKKLQRDVQTRIREETKGRFFGDGWSTSSAPRATYLVTSLLMLAVVLLAWWLLGPQGLEVVK